MCLRKEIFKVYVDKRLDCCVDRRRTRFRPELSRGGFCAHGKYEHINNLVATRGVAPVRPLREVS